MACCRIHCCLRSLSKLVPPALLPLAPRFDCAPANSRLLQYLDKRLFVQLNGSRKVIGVLRGYDVFLNIVLDEAVEEKDGGEKVKLGMVVRIHLIHGY